MKNESSFNYIKSFIDVSLNISFWETLLVHASDNDTILLNQLKLLNDMHSVTVHLSHISTFHAVLHVLIHMHFITVLNLIVVLMLTTITKHSFLNFSTFHYFLSHPLLNVIISHVTSHNTIDIS